MTARPDIIILILDTQRADRLSCYGYPRATSPQIDALAADATRFNYAVSAAQWTIPSHASMFTGVYPSVHGTQQTFSRLPDNLPTLAERLRDGGYYTAGFCNNPLVGVVNNGLRRGFMSFLNYAGLLTSRPNQAGARADWIGKYRQFFKRLLGNFVHKIQDSFARSDKLLEFALTPLMIPLWQTALSFKGNTSKSLNHATQLLIERKGVEADQPIFTFINLMGTHMPFHPDRRYIEQFAPDVLQDKAAQHYLHKFNSDPFGWLTPLGSTLAAEHKAIIDGMYDAEVASQDELIGQFIARLRSSGALDNTLLMVSADHGEHLGEKQMLGHSVSLYHELTHVPLIIRDPAGDLPRGGTVERIVSNRRLFHTALTAAKLADAGEQHYTLARETRITSAEDPVFAEAVPPENVISLLKKHQPELIAAHRYDQKRRAVWQGDYKFIETGADGEELFDLARDPEERENLSKTLPEQATVMRRHLHSFEQKADMAALPTEQIVEHDQDELMSRRLRALGYLE